MTILEAIKPFDEDVRKGYNFYEITSALFQVDEVEKNLPEYKYEMLGFKLVPSQVDNPWGFYFGPQSILADKDGNPTYVPNLTEISIEAILYWEKRCKECKNPLLVARYAGLVWDFKLKIAHQPYEPDLYRCYVDSMFRICNEDYCSHPILTINELERLFVITKEQEDDLRKTKKAYNAFEDRHASDDSVRLWASQFLIMIENKKYFTHDEKNALVKAHEDRLKRLSTPNKEGKVNPWTVKSQAEILSQYYNTVQKKKDIIRVLSIVEESFQHEANNLNAMQLMANLEQVHRIYCHYGLEKETSSLSIKIQKTGEKAKNEMKPYIMEYDIPKEVYEQADEMFGEKVSSNEVRWNNFAVYFIPRKQNEELKLQELVRKYPFKFMVSTNLMDMKGRPMSIVGTYEADPEGQLILHIAEKINIEAIFLELAIHKLLSTNTFTTATVMEEIIRPSPLFEEDRYGIIQEALDCFIDTKYTLFCHLIVPQIECALCNLVELSGSKILKPQRKGKGFQLRTLDDLLREKVIEETFTEDGAYYLR